MKTRVVSRRKNDVRAFGARGGAISAAQAKQYVICDEETVWYANFFDADGVRVGIPFPSADETS